MKSRVLGFLQLLRQLQAVQQNMCATSAVKFSAATIHLHITRVSIRGKPDAPFVRSCSLGNTLWCLIFRLSMALNISTDNINSAFYRLWKCRFILCLLVRGLLLLHILVMCIKFSPVWFVAWNVQWLWQQLYTSTGKTSWAGLHSYLNVLNKIYL
jgi:hypothetical protein